MDPEIAVSIDNLSKTFYVRDNGAPFLKKITSLITNKDVKKVVALSDINIQVKKGEFLGIIGRNGSGKSTLLKLIMGAIKPDKGSKITTTGKMMRLALGMGFDPNLTARDNIYLNGTILGLSFRQIGERFDEIIDFAGLPDFVDTPIRFYSSGMKSRLYFAVALHANADIFLIDEFFGGVGDMAFRAKSQKAFENILKGKTIIHVSHSMNIIRKNCDRAMIIDKGKQIIVGKPDEVIKTYSELYNKSKLKPQPVKK